MLIAFRPEAVTIARQQMEGINALRGDVVSVTFVGDAVEYVINVGGMEVRVKGEPFDAATVGETIWLRVPPTRCLVIADGANVPGRRLKSVGSAEPYSALPVLPKRQLTEFAQ